jgi:GNAT superfamily N-acetyltransferase
MGKRTASFNTSSVQLSDASCAKHAEKWLLRAPLTANTARMTAAFDEITTVRLQLVPFDEATARAVLNGDLTGVDAAEGWPHDGTINGLSHAIELGETPGWMITLSGRVIGDCGTHGSADADGAIEIGYGLAGPFRDQGYGTEAVGAMTEWLLRQPGTRTARASTLADNIASRRVLEKNGFSLTGYDADGQVLYQCGS